MAWKQLRHQFWLRSSLAWAVVMSFLQHEQGKLFVLVEVCGVWEGHTY